MRRFVTFVPAAALVLALVSACGNGDDGAYLGYVEGETVYVSASVAGDLRELSVERGQTVQAGAPLFALDPAPQSFGVTEATERLAQARARAADLEKGSRPSELSASEARLARARAALEQAERELERRRAVREAGGADAVSDEELDRFRTAAELQRLDVATFEAELETLRLGGREDAVTAARREVGVTEASLRSLEWQLAEKRVVAPAGGLVQDTLFRVGEHVPAGRAVVALLPPENVLVRFFVPQEDLPRVAPGTSLEVRVDGVDEPLAATVSFVASEAEYTPPVIFSKDVRHKLVFLVEARPAASAVERLRPGQPLEVVLARSP